MAATIYEVARRAGVSTATVSRVMAGGRGFSEVTRKRVLAAVADLGWRPNAAAQGLAARRTGIVGIVFPDLGKYADDEDESPLFVDQVIRGAERAATVAGSALLLAATRGASQRDLLDSVVGKVDGLVVVPRALSRRQLTEVARRLPVVVLSPLGVPATADFVTADNRAGLRALVAHLTLEHGHRDLRFIAGPLGSPDSVERFQGFRDGCSEAGLPVPDAPHESGRFTEAGGAEATRRLLAAGPAPDVIVAGNDEMAVGALRVLRDARLRVPGDVAVTGFDDIATGRHVRPALTTVAQPMREIGERAVRALLDRVADPDLPRRTSVLPTALVLRRSCGCGTARTDRHEASL